MKLWNALNGIRGQGCRRLRWYDRNGSTTINETLLQLSLTVHATQHNCCSTTIYGRKHCILGESVGVIKHPRVRSPPRESWQHSLCSPQVELADFVLLLVRRTPPSLSSTPLYFLSVLSHHNASLITTASKAGTHFIMHQVAGRPCAALLPHISALARGKPEQDEAQARKIDEATA